MNTFFIIFALFLIGAKAETPEDFEAKRTANHEACSKISKLDEATIKTMRSGTFDETNPAVQEHVYCYTQKVGFINEKAELQKDVIRMKMSQQVKNAKLVDKAIQVCTFPLTGDQKMWACKTLACFYKIAPGVVIL
nr:odorant binding protein [Hippodamia variegata]